MVQARRLVQEKSAPQSIWKLVWKQANIVQVHTHTHSAQYKRTTTHLATQSM
jgi:hypothetical protein